MEVANASLYDGATATAEAAMMANRLTRRKKAILAGSLHPHYAETTRDLCALQRLRGGAAPARSRRHRRSRLARRWRDILRRRAESRLLRLAARLSRAGRSCHQRRRAAGRRGDRGGVARPGRAAGRDGRRHRRGRGPIARQCAGFRRAVSRPLRHARQIRAPDAGPARRRDASTPKAGAASC